MCADLLHSEVLSFHLWPSLRFRPKLFPRFRFQNSGGNTCTTSEDLLIVTAKARSRRGNADERFLLLSLSPAAISLCCSHCRLPRWAIIRAVKPAVNMPEQTRSSFYTSQRRLPSTAAESYSESAISAKS